MTTSTTGSTRFVIFAPTAVLFGYAIIQKCSPLAFEYEFFQKSRSRKLYDYNFGDMACTNNTALGVKMTNVVLVVIAKAPYFGQVIAKISIPWFFKHYRTSFHCVKQNYKLQIKYAIMMFFELTITISSISSVPRVTRTTK